MNCKLRGGRVNVNFREDLDQIVYKVMTVTMLLDKTSMAFLVRVYVFLPAKSILLL